MTASRGWVGSAILHEVTADRGGYKIHTYYTAGITLYKDSLYGNLYAIPIL